MVHVSELELRELGEDDIDDFVRLSRRSFGFPPGAPARPERLAGGATRHGAFLGGRLVGQAFDLHDQQWWGGELLAAADLAGVATAAEVRGRGVATAVVRRLLEMAHDRGAVVSALFPSISTVYRRFGWTVAGGIAFVDMPTAALPNWPVPDGLEVREGTPADLPGTYELYRRIAMARNGMLSRTEGRFHREREELPEGVDGLTVVLDGDDVVGYCTWARGEGYGADAALTVFDLLADSPAAARALIGVLRSWHTIVGTVRIRMLAGDVVSELLPLELGRLDKMRSWMHRPVDIAGAVAARTWPAGAGGRARFAIEDDMAPWNSGTWALEVDGGKAELRRTTDDAAVGLTVNGFASLYCGLTTASALRQAGHVTGPYEDAAVLDVLGTSAPPRLLDSF